MAKSGFKDPAAIKGQAPVDKPVDGKQTLWDFRCPQYDERSSCFIKAGTNYGEAHRQPVGTESVTMAGGVPYGKVSTMSTDSHR